MFIVPLYMLQDGINIGKGSKVLIVFFKLNNVFSVQIHSGNYANQGTMCAKGKDPLPTFAFPYVMRFVYWPN